VKSQVFHPHGVHVRHHLAMFRMNDTNLDIMFAHEQQMEPK